MDDEWMTSSELGARLNASPRSIAANARGYTDGKKADRPILRRHTPRGVEYRRDPDADWSAEKVRRLKVASGLTYTEIAAEVGACKSDIAAIARESQWAAKPLHPKLNALADEYGLSPECEWWAVCDDVCGRLVVEAVREEREAAERIADGDQYTNDTCRPRIVRGEGEAPSVGRRVTDDEIAEVVR